MSRKELDWEDEYSARKRRHLVPRIARTGGIGIAGAALIIALYYLIGMMFVHEIADDTAFQPTDVPAAGSRAVAITAQLINRETDVNGWVANDPFYLPGAVLDNMPNFQQGIVYALSRFALEMADQLGRTRGSSEVDTDLDKAAGLLKYPGTVWIFDFSTSLAPTASSEAQYRAAARSLDTYNTRLAAGAATYERRADNLQATLVRFTADLGSRSAIIDQHMAVGGTWGIDTRADDIFYATKGRLYAYYMLLRELGADFENVIRDREIGTAWQQMLDSIRQAAELSPVIVINASPDGLFMPSHLASMGFYLLRARTQLREIVSILQK